MVDKYLFIHMYMYIYIYIYRKSDLRHGTYDIRLFVRNKLITPCKLMYVSKYKAYIYTHTLICYKNKNTNKPVVFFVFCFLFLLSALFLIWLNETQILNLT